MNCWLPDSSQRPVGASGVPSGVPDETLDHALQPALLRARTRTWWLRWLVRPEMVVLVATETVAMSIRSLRSSTVTAANSGNLVLVEVWSHPSIQM